MYMHELKKKTNNLIYKQNNKITLQKQNLMKFPDQFPFKNVF